MPEGMEAPASGSPAEEWIVAVFLAVLGAARVAIALVNGEELAVDVTLAGILGVIGLVLLGQLVGRRRRG